MEENKDFSREYDEVIDDRTLGQKVRGAFYDANKAVKNFGRWCVKNPVPAISLAGVVVSGAVGLARSHAKNLQTKEETIRRLQSVYDRSNGHYFDLNKAPSASEWAEIDRRREDGEAYWKILSDMNLI